jgi:hypothetical protein
LQCFTEIGPTLAKKHPNSEAHSDALLRRYQSNPILAAEHRLNSEAHSDASPPFPLHKSKITCPVLP